MALSMPAIWCISSRPMPMEESDSTRQASRISAYFMQAARPASLVRKKVSLPCFSPLTRPSLVSFFSA